MKWIVNQVGSLINLERATGISVQQNKDFDVVAYYDSEDTWTIKSFPTRKMANEFILSLLHSFKKEEVIS